MATRYPAIYSPVHERQEYRHRIVILHADGTNDTGEWYLISETAWHKLGFYANSNSASVFPPGIFKVREVAHQVLA